MSKTLAGEWVQVMRVEHRLLVFYCNTLIRELDPASQRSNIIERWLPGSSETPKV
jgi:hypothetical protein